MDNKIDKNTEMLRNEWNFALHKVMGRVRSYEKRMIAESGLNVTTTDLRYIALINSNPQWRQKDILDYLSISKGSLSNELRKLQENGLVVSVASKKDKRINIVELTEAGKEVAELNTKIRTTIREFLLEKLSKKELAMLQDLAVKLR